MFLNKSNLYYSFLLLIFLISCKKECSEPNPTNSPKRISSIRISANNSEHGELHFIYNADNKISKIVSRSNNHDYYIDYQYSYKSIHINGFQWESQHLNPDGYPDTIYTSWGRYFIIDYLSPGVMNTKKIYNESDKTLTSSMTYKYENDKLIEVVHEDHILGGKYSEQIKYSGNKLVQYGAFYISYNGNCASRIVVRNNPEVDHTKEIQYGTNCDYITHLTENTILPNDSIYRDYEFEYEDGIGEFPFFWHTNFYHLTNMPNFIAHTWGYGGI